MLKKPAGAILQSTHAVETKDVFGSRTRGMERNGSIPMSRDGSDPVFGSEKVEERNGSVFCSVCGIEERNEN